MSEKRQVSPIQQIIISIVSVALVSALCYLGIDAMGYKVVALILLMTVSILALLLDILPVILASCLSAISLNFLFIPPVFTFHIDNSEDILLFSLYFVIALVSAVLSNRIKKTEKKLRDREEKVNTIKLYNTLLNSLSHELRTPISTIIGAVDTLKEKDTHIPENVQGELLNEISKAAWRLNGQVEKLLNMSRLESGTLKPRLDWCDMTDLISSIVRKTECVPDKISMQFDEPLPLFKLDQGLIEQVVMNILQNAIVHTPASSKIIVRTSFDSGACRIIISDNGDGIHDELKDKVFDKFYRISSSGTGGSGLGLSIAKGFVEAMGGEILLSDSAEGGAQFSVYVPCEVSFISELKHE